MEISQADKSIGNNSQNLTIQYCITEHRVYFMAILY